jgi:outer membrane lipoprotein-sorting protein
MKKIALLLLFGLNTLMAQDARDIIKAAEDHARGDKHYAEMEMTIIRPSWERTMGIKSWALGQDLAIIYISSPARDKGAAFLKRGKEIWNWQPKINRSIKLPTSMMMQSWMGSDFTNDDLVKESSILNDYDHELLGQEVIEGRNCYKIRMIPKEDSDVVWGSIISWIDTNDYLQLKSEFYDEDGYLINSMYGNEVKMIGGKLLPTELMIIPAEEEGHKTIIKYSILDFNTKVDASFFSIQSMKKVR